MAKVLASLSVLAELLLPSWARGAVWPTSSPPLDLQALAQAARSLQLVRSLEEQDAALWAQAGAPVEAAEQLQRVRQRVPEPQLRRLAQWALQEGLASLVAPGSWGAGSVVPGGLRDADPFGVLLGMSRRTRALQPVTAWNYLRDVGDMAGLAPALIGSSQEGGRTQQGQAQAVYRRGAAAGGGQAQAAEGESPADQPPLPADRHLHALMRLCQARRALVATWQAVALRTSNPEAQAALRRGLQRVASEAASARSYCQALLAWQAAHDLMVARDLAQVDLRLVRQQLQGKFGSGSEQGAQALQALERAERVWDAVVRATLHPQGLGDAFVPPSSSPAAAHTSAPPPPPSQQPPSPKQQQQQQPVDAHVDGAGSSGRAGGGASEWERQGAEEERAGAGARLPSAAALAALQEDMRLVWGLLTPHRNVSTEVSLVLTEYEAEVTARLAQVGWQRPYHASS